MADGHHLCAPGCSWGDMAKSLGMLHMLSRSSTLCQLGQLLPCRPHREHSMSLTDLNQASGHRRLRGQAIQDPIVGQVAIPADGCRSSVAKRSQANACGKGESSSRSRRSRGRSWVVRCTRALMRSHQTCAWRLRSSISVKQTPAQ